MNVFVFYFNNNFIFVYVDLWWVVCGVWLVVDYREKCVGMLIISDLDIGE